LSKEYFVNIFLSNPRTLLSDSPLVHGPNGRREEKDVLYIVVMTAFGSGASTFSWGELHEPCTWLQN
jgi:hypothetical protein